MKRKWRKRRTNIMWRKRRRRKMRGKDNVDDEYHKEKGEEEVKRVDESRVSDREIGGG